jgi:hypothetical protein
MFYWCLKGSLRLGVYDTINCFLFNAVRTELCVDQVLDYVRSFLERWKICSKQFHIKYWVKDKERGNTYFKIILTHSLSDGVRPISKWEDLLMGSCEVLFLQMQPYLISHLKLVWYPMLIMEFLVLGVGFIKNSMNLLLNVLNSLKKFGCSTASV